ncbi:putative ferric-chelate reductase 1 homolog [Pomacea canaliculata]|uniref:putative ferric-chelate reductase 1 homolog n=1 Tax=Pomacea canaliculata TaxID=400727 RepID=UPI000D7389F6|nr:putative ferric-chelate reductase 1 homolog [Pomacea canaliculata]XP_025109626.1 putative ferric-chelate reductase 1 homolog [Pomacea canaliculata]
MMLAVVLLLLGSIPQCVWAYSSGAPDRQLVCAQLTPSGHTPSTTQTTPSPYRISVSSLTYTPNGSNITVTLESPCGAGTTFKGYLLKVDYAELNHTNSSLGSFNTPAGSKSICEGNGRTHDSSTEKQSIQFLWTPPATSVGTIVFRATFVQSYSTFWVDVHSDLIYETSKTTPPPTELLSTVRTVVSPNDCPQTTQSTQTIQSTQSNQVTIATDPDCGKTKGCFSDCIGGSCTYLVTWIPSADFVTITLEAFVGSGNRYVALGLSKDLNMGDDSVIECVNDGVVVSVHNSYNDGRNNKRLSQEGLNLTSGSYKNQILRCEFTRLKAEGLDGNRFTLVNRSYTLFLAKGPSYSGGISRHDERPKVSGIEFNLESTLSDSSTADIKSQLVKAHGSLMMVAWIFAASLGIVMARYFKPMWPDSKLFGQKVWFQIHRGSMVLVLLCTVIAFIIIFVKVGDYSELSGEDYKKAHPVLGIIVTALCIINPIMALFRCHPGTKNRPIFNWAHWAVGFVAYILGVITIFFGVKLEGADAPEYIVYVLAAFVCWQILVFLILELVQLLGRMFQRSNTYEMSDPNLPAKPVGEKQEAILAKNVLLACHIVALFGFIIALLVILNIN